jgi:hypothetical protein
VAYPRPLVPSHYDEGTGSIIPGDQPGTFTTGWRFNQPENEVLINMGNQLNLMQPTRRAYFVFLFKIDPALSKGIYHIPFAISAHKRHYSGVNHGDISYDVPDALFCIAGKNANGLVSEFEKIVLDHTALQNLHVALTDNFKPTGRIKWSVTDFGREQFNAIPGNLSVSGNEIDLSKFSAFPSADTTQLVIMQEGTVDSYNSGADLVRLTDGQTLNFTHAGQEKSVLSERLAVKPVGPRIRVKNTVYSINGVVVNDTIMYEPEADLYVKTLLTATNTGSDISSQTIIRINPGEFYGVVIDSLDENCSYSNGMLIVDMGDIAPGDMKEQLLPFILRPQELPEGIDIRTVIEQSDISYEGTLVNVSFNFTDTGKVTLDLYDFEATTISYDDLGNGQVQINATINNRGINASDVWLRIYPVIGGGTYEFPVAELRVENFSPLQSIDISGIYTLPVTDKSIDFIAIADDGYDYTEITEVNNTIEVNYRATGIEDIDHSSNSLQVFPVPFNDEVSFSYTLNGDYGNLQLKVYNMSGKLSMLISNCPANKGSNLVTWRNSSMPAGNYIYKLTGENMGHEVLLFSGMLVKTAL